MSLFKKPKKNIQRRVFSSLEDEENEENHMEVDVVTNNTSGETQESTKKKKKERAAPKQTLLSFDDEEQDGEVFQVKKSSHSKKIMRLLDKERKKKKEKMDVDNNEPQEKINDERKEIITDDLVVVVKKSEKTDKSLILNGRAALAAGRNDMSSDEEEEPNHPIHRFSNPVDSVKIVVESGIIPDAAMIHAARKRRQRARELGGDFVPVENAEKKDRGRLVREEDGDSDEERIDMTVNMQAQDKEKRREQFFAAQDEDSDHDGSDKEREEWENQQIRKGVTVAQINAVQQESVYGVSGGSSYSTLMDTNSIVSNDYSSVKQEDVGPKTPETIANKLRERFASLQMNYDNHERQLMELSDEINTSQSKLEALDKRAPNCGKRFHFYQELRGYVTDLVECLDEKVPLIKNVEQRWADAMGRRAVNLAERRRQDVRDQAEEITAQARTGMRREEAHVRRAAEREGRRNRRRRAREQAALALQQTAPKHLDGMSSDDEVPDQENMQFNQQKEQILADAEQIFSDVIDDYSSLNSILEHFESWRGMDFQEYTEAYASLILPKAIGPILRLQILSWDPLNPDSPDIESFKWFKKLMLYGLLDDETEESLRSDPDVNFVPAVIDKIVIPKLTEIVEKAWDPMSSSQSLRLVGLVGRFIRRYPTLGPGSQSLSNLFSVVVDKLKQAVEHDVFIPILSKQDTKAPLFQRQFNSGVKLLGNITRWQGTLVDRILKDLALNSLLNRYLLSGLRVCQITDAVTKAQLILNALPRTWLQNASTLDHLRMYITCVTQFAGQLNPDNPLHLESLEIIASIKNTLHI